MAQQRTAAARQIDADGLNGQFIADLLSGFLAHERCGSELYEAVSARTKNPALKARYEDFGRETKRHVEILTALIAECGGDPSYVSPIARCVESQDRSLLQATLSANPESFMVLEMAMLDAVFVAESVDHANWQALSQMAEKLNSHAMGSALKRAVAEVEPEEDKHLRWAHDTRARMTMLQAGSSAMEARGEKAEEMFAKLQDWLKG
jgi:rubrerythrin